MIHEQTAMGAPFSRDSCMAIWWPGAKCSSSSLSLLANQDIMYTSYHHSKIDAFHPNTNILTLAARQNKPTVVPPRRTQ